MYTIHNYIENTYLLTKSLVIKIQDTALSINKGLEFNYGLIIPEDKSLWKYYLNLNGTKHSTNSDIIIFLKETGQSVTLTKELLETNTITKNELLKQGQYYEDLISRYPDDIAYINGMLFPVPIQDAIDAADGTILNYNRHYVEVNELSLIRELNQHTIGFVSRWHVRDYTLTDNLYLTSMLAVMYSTIPNKIINIRLSKINTNEVDSFHLEHFFRSHLDCWEYVQLLNKESIIWLYKNMKYILKNTGKEETLNLIIKNIFTTNGVGIGKYVLNRSDVETSTANSNNPLLPAYNKPNAYVTTTKLNDYYVSDNDNSKKIEDIVKLELSNDTTLDTYISNSDVVNYGNTVNDMVYENDIISQDTKLLDLNSVNVFDIHGIDQMQITLDQWIYMAYNGKYSRVNEFRDPNTSLFYNLSPKQGLYVFLMLLQELTDNESPLTHYDYYSAIDNTVTIEYLKENLLLQDDDNEYIVNTIINSLPNTPNTIPNTTAFNEYIKSVISFFITNNILMSNVNNLALSGNIKSINDKVLKRGTISLLVNYESYTPRELLAMDGITFSTSGIYDYEKSLSSLLHVFTGMKSNEYDDVRTYLNGFINILNKLTSYTTQIVSSIEDLEYVSVKYSGLSVNSMPSGLVTVTEATTNRVLEEIVPEIVGEANNFETRILGYGKFNDVSGCLVDTITGICVSYNSERDIDIVYDKPVFTAEVMSCKSE